MGKTMRQEAEIKVRVTAQKKSHYVHVAETSHEGTLSDFVKSACDFYAEYLEAEQRKALKDAMTFTDEDVMKISKALSQPAKDNKALKDFMTTDHLNHDGLQEKLNDYHHRKTKSKKA
ncbi:type II toxin -antitoxin system TacA 1-like antitoxin [Piscirickettsia litoralis]|uniref:Uncharacterized protein n=1 Tax=Piscirickettsia litoralis TaxID=1891921 RepID=A0ABX2ZZ72_9GAMM|nr:DUF1778 domain-containing protein [Piscirickettsia litoralis]ODN41317.1 hypothetical protein BGC07_17295 [Piscirickettsia litoralis]